MNPCNFLEANAKFGPPPGLEESQVRSIDVYQGVVRGGSCDGSIMIITAWVPSAEDIQRMAAGHPIFLTCLGGLPPHFLSTDFQIASNPQ